MEVPMDVPMDVYLKIVSVISWETNREAKLASLSGFKTVIYLVKALASYGHRYFLYKPWNFLFSGDHDRLSSEEVIMKMNECLDGALIQANQLRDYNLRVHPVYGRSYLTFSHQTVARECFRAIRLLEGSLDQEKAKSQFEQYLADLLAKVDGLVDEVTGE